MQIEHPAQSLELIEHSSRETKHSSERRPFLVAQLENVRSAQGGFKDFPGVKLLTQIYIENPQSFGPHGVKERMDCGERDVVSLGERSEANGIRARCQIKEVLVEVDVVPSHIGEDFIGRLAVSQSHMHAPSGMGGIGLDMGVGQIFRGEDLADFGTVIVGPHGAHGMSGSAELSAVVAEIQRGATELFSFREDIP